MEQFSIRSQTYDGRYLELICTQEPVPEENKSIVHWTLTAAGGNANYYTTGPTTLTIDGQPVYYAPTTYWNSYEFPAAKGSVSGSIEIPHQSDGTRYVECSITTSIYNGVMQEKKATWEMEAIPRESTAGATDAYIGGTSIIVIDKKNPAYTHTLAFSFKALSGYILPNGSISEAPVKFDAANVAFCVPEAFYAQITDQKAEWCTLTCTTYSGDVQIGEVQSSRFLASCREDECSPVIKGTVVDSNDHTLALTGNENTMVRFFSCAKCHIDAFGRWGASITQKQVAGISMEEDILEIPNVESGTFLFRATDTRGFTAEYPEEKNLIPYQKLTAVVTANRTEPTSNKVLLVVEGKCFWGSFGVQENSVQISCRANGAETVLDLTPTEDGYTAQGYIDGLSYQSSHTLQIVARDKLMEISTKSRVNPGVPVFDWGAKDFAFHVPVTLEDGSPAISQKALIEEIYPVHSIVIRYDDISPAALFGGVWERIVNPETGEGVFLLSCPEGDEIGKFDGASEVTLTEEQLPSHSHGFQDYWNAAAGTANRYAVALNGDGEGTDGKTNDRSYTANTGGGEAHNNMPPYVTVAIWRRVE